VWEKIYAKSETPLSDQGCKKYFLDKLFYQILLPKMEATPKTPPVDIFRGTAINENGCRICAGFDS
jgi:hypothetical protein